MDTHHRFALLGCGKIARKHAEIIQNHLEEGELVGVCDIDKEKSLDFGSKYKINSFVDFESMISKMTPDTIVVLTPSGLHAQNIRDLCKLKKNIIVEKPLALKLEDAKNILELCAKNQISLSVVKQNRFNKPIVLLKKYIEEGRLGKLFLSSVRVRWSRPQSYYDEADWRGSWRLDGGVISNQASHHIDMIQWLMGDVESVYARGNNYLANIEAEDTAVVNLKFKNGALGVIEASTAIRPKDLEGSISILGSKGSVEIGGFSMNTIRTCELQDYEKGLEKSLDEYSNPEGDRNFSHKQFYKDYLNRVKSNLDPLVDSKEAIKSLSIIHAIYKSIEERREVFLSESNLQSRLGE